MKPYNERLPLIDAAIEYHNGKWPQDKSPYGEECLVLLDNGNYITTMGISGKDGYLCNKGQFEQRAKELGWVNGHKWGVEYETNGEKPDLPDDVVIDYMIAWHSGHKKWVNGSIVSSVSWFGVEKFRIVDERYKPKENTMNNDWYEKGELPPVGEKVIAIDKRTNADGNKCELRYISSEVCVLYDIYDDCEFAVHPCHVEFRPLRTETDKLIKQMKRDLSGEWGVSLQRANAICSHLIKKGYRKIKPMSEDEFVKCTLKSFDIKRFEVSQLKLICELLRKLYRAGCRFLDQGE